MGFRTVVVLQNDLAHEWENDPLLGKKIASAMNYVNDRFAAMNEFHGGAVVECVHADAQTLMVLDGYSGKAVTYGNWRQNETQEQIQLKLLKEAARKLGYNLVKKSTKGL